MSEIFNAPNEVNPATAANATESGDANVADATLPLAAPASTSEQQHQPSAEAAEAEASSIPQGAYVLKVDDLSKMLSHASNDIYAGTHATAERAIKVIDGMTVAIQEKTMHINQTEAMAIVFKMEELMQQQLSTAATTSIEYRTKFITSMNDLASQVIHNAAWISDRCRENVIERRRQMVETATKASEQIQENAERVTEEVSNKFDSAKHEVSQSIATVDSYMHNWIHDLAEVHPKTAAAVHKFLDMPGVLSTPEGRTDTAHDVMNVVNTNVVQPVSANTTAAYQTVANSTSNAASNMYNAAMPIVTGAIDTAKPYMDRAVDTATPYVDQVKKKAADLLQPYTDR